MRVTVEIFSFGSTVHTIVEAQSVEAVETTAQGLVDASALSGSDYRLVSEDGQELV